MDLQQASLETQLAPLWDDVRDAYRTLCRRTAGSQSPLMPHMSPAQLRFESKAVLLVENILKPVWRSRVVESMKDAARRETAALPSHSPCDWGGDASGRVQLNQTQIMGFSSLYAVLGVHGT